MNVSQSHRRSLFRVQLTADASNRKSINICAVTVENNVNTDIILILTFAIDYLHFVF